MVGPSLTDEERDAANLQLQAGFVVLVALSGGLVALAAGGTVAHLAAGVGGGLLLGLVLLVLLLRWGRQFRQTGPSRPQ
jgi:cyanate permease